MSTPEGVDDLLQRLADGELPDNVRLAAARGALPLPIQDLVRVQVFLASEDPSDEVRSLAAQALVHRDASDTAAVVADENVPGDVATYFAARPETPAPVVEALAQNIGCPETALNQLAARPEPGVLDRLLRNEVLLIRCPDSLALLEVNDGLSPGQRDRLAEIRLHFVERPLPHTKPDAPPLEPELAQQVVEAMVAAEEYERDSTTSAPTAGADEPDGSEEEEEEQTKHAMFRIMDMTTAEKVKLAFLGSAEERVILLRDSNRVVATSVLKSPRVSDKDVEAYANMRSLSEELIVMISNRRVWMRSYQVMLAVVRHPKSPPRITVNLMPLVKDRELNLLLKDRNLPETTRQALRRVYLARTQRKKH
ncbi:MAG: hypothetical protein V3U11_09415 [Planctomycetota bacterium]